MIISVLSTYSTIVSICSTIISVVSICSTVISLVSICRFVVIQVIWSIDSSRRRQYSHVPEVEQAAYEYYGVYEEDDGAGNDHPPHPLVTVPVDIGIPLAHHH